MANLKVLGIEIQTFPFTRYRDDGFVDSTFEHLIRLSDRYSQPHPSQESIESTHGYTLLVAKRFRDYIHIFYENQGNERDNLALRAHEETHVLELTRNLRLLEERLLKDQHVRLDLNPRTVNNSHLDRSEIVAYLGGIYALKKNGFNPEEIQPDNEHYHQAKEIYLNSRIK